MTDYASRLVDYIEDHSKGGRLAAELFAEENFSPDWRTKTQQPYATQSVVVDSGDNDE